MEEQSYSIVEIISYKVGKFSWYALLIIFMAATIVAPVSILTAQTRQTMLK